MDFQPINPNVVPLLQGLKPYLGNKGQVITDGLSSFVKLLSSQHGQEAVKTMSQVFTTTGKGDKVITIDTVGGPVTFSLSLAFTLFLILILLILSGNLLSLTPGMYGGCPDNSAVNEDSASVEY